MATGNYGTIRGADFSPQDAEVLVHYTPSRDQLGDTVFTRLNAADVLIKIDEPNSVGEQMGGVFTLKLPTNVVSAKGIYNILIRPAQIRTQISDCGVLASAPDIPGLVFKISTIDGDFVRNFENDGLTGYRVEYITTNPTSGERKLQNIHRLVTSSNRAEPISDNLNNTTQKSVKYRFNDTSDLLFCTVSPSSAPNVKPNSTPFIGVPGQQVIITNTYFDPFMIELELVEHDFETLAIGLFGNQTKSIDDGIYTIYNFDNEIYKQYNLFEIRDDFNNSLFEVREERDIIDTTKDFDNITNT